MMLTLNYSVLHKNLKIQIIHDEKSSSEMKKVLKRFNIKRYSLVTEELLK